VPHTMLSVRCISKHHETYLVELRVS
jgi:hypothetical protein